MHPRNIPSQSRQLRASQSAPTNSAIGSSSKLAKPCTKAITRITESGNINQARGAGCPSPSRAWLRRAVPTPAVCKKRHGVRTHLRRPHPPSRLICLQRALLPLIRSALACPPASQLPNTVTGCALLLPSDSCCLVCHLGAWKRRDAHDSMALRR